LLRVAPSPAITERETDCDRVAVAPSRGLAGAALSLKFTTRPAALVPVRATVESDAAAFVASRRTLLRATVERATVSVDASAALSVAAVFVVGIARETAPSAANADGVQKAMMKKHVKNFLILI